jgi:hypothetical protein
VTLPEPNPGLVIRYSYLWHNEYRTGREEGVKDRPCALIAAIEMDEDGKTRVLVIPITHTAPVDVDAIEIPQPIKELLNLDAGRSWIVLSEWNDFVWPGPDLRPVPGADPSTISYGALPPRFFATVRARFTAIARQGKAHRVPRSE